MSDKSIICLLSHKCRKQVCDLGNRGARKRVRTLSARLAQSLSRYHITLLIDPFRYGEDFGVRMKSVEFDALLLLISPASLKSKAVQVELKTARRKGVPIFTALLEGEISGPFRRRLSWRLDGLDNRTFEEQVHALADAMQIRVSIHKQVQLLSETNPADITREAAQNVIGADDRTVVAEFARDLARRYRQITDPATCFFIALALGKACTPEAARLLRALPTKDHPLPLEGIREALEMIAHG